MAADRPDEGCSSSHSVQVPLGRGFASRLAEASKRPARASADPHQRCCVNTRALLRSSLLEEKKIGFVPNACIERARSRSLYEKSLLPFNT